MNDKYYLIQFDEIQANSLITTLTVKCKKAFYELDNFISTVDKGKNGVYYS